MRKRREDTVGPRMKRLYTALRGVGGIALASSMASLAFASTASATPPTPPFNQCTGYGFDSSCATLLVINAQGGLETYVDPSQGSYDAEYDELVGVQNDSSSLVTSIALHGNNIFGFYGKGLCSGLNESGKGGFRPSPAECPFGLTGYEGPDTSFSGYKEEDQEENANEGTLNFTKGALQPGQSTYFTLAGRPEANCQETHCEPLALSTELSGGAESGTNITVPDGTAVSDSVTLSGPNASIATGDVDYSVYRDDECKELVAENEVAVTDGSVPPLGPETFAPGSYYWTASYTGDSHNGSAQSACGSEVETVSAPPTCSKLVGGGHYGSGSQRQTVKDRLNTGLSGTQTFSFTWAHTASKLRLKHLNTASCAITGGEETFSGRGSATLNRKTGYEVSFSVTLAGGHAFLSVTVGKAHVVLDEFTHEQLVMPKKHPELIS